ncbi:unnamed protein product [Closterium sp. NIES-53]
MSESRNQSTKTLKTVSWRGRLVTVALREEIQHSQKGRELLDLGEMSQTGPVDIIPKGLWKTRISGVMETKQRRRRVARSAGMSIHDDVMQALVHLTLTYAEQLARDVQLFARHAKRKRVEPDDIILSAHRNQDLTKKLRELAAVVGQEGRAIKSKASAKTDVS